MGMFKKIVRVSNVYDQNKYFSAEFWVDTGALYSFIPEDRLEEIGIEPTSRRSLIMADGRTDVRLFGACNFKIEQIKETLPCPVIFAPKKSLYLLGATALENFGVEVDPINKDIKPILAIIGGFIASSVD